MMSNQSKCDKCDTYSKAGHNYCKMCGYHLTKGHTQYIRVAVENFTNEKFCGYCGKEIKDCKC